MQGAEEDDVEEAIADAVPLRPEDFDLPEGARVLAEEQHQNLKAPILDRANRVQVGSWIWA